MKDQFWKMLAAVVGSRKAVATVGAVVLNLFVVLFMRFGIELSESTQKAISEAAAGITEAIMVYVFAQGGIDAIQKLKESGGQGGSNSEVR